MNIRTVGFILSALLISMMIVMMVKSNVEEPNSIVDLRVETNSIIPAEKSGLKIGEIPPDFELSTISGDMVKLSDLKGQKVILNFWTSWCTWCKSEMPHMEKYYKNYQESSNVEIIAVNLTESERQGLKGIQRFIDAFGLTFPIPLDIDGKVDKAYGIVSIPTTYMIGTNGEIGQIINGPMDEKSLKSFVDNLE